MYISTNTLDDLMRSVLSVLLERGNRIRPSRGYAREVTGVLLEITNPRARHSVTETRGRLVSSLGELLWYLAKSRDLQFITYYLSRYQKESDDDETVYGAYGPRLFKMRGINQIQNVLSLLKRKRDSRQAVIQLFDAEDIADRHKGVPCTCTLQFMVRRRKLQMLTSMRSNDAYVGIPHDVFAFTMLQEILARTLGVDLGTYRHFVGSLHLYDRDRAGAKRYLEEGWQARVPMPPMPKGDPWNSIQIVLRAERAIREDRSVEIPKLGLDPYWADLVRLLKIYWHFQRSEEAEIAELKRQMSHRRFESYIDDMRGRLQRRAKVAASR